MRFQTREKGGATILFEMAFRPRARSGFRVLLTRFYYGYIFIHNAKVNASRVSSSSSSSSSSSRVVV